MKNEQKVKNIIADLATLTSWEKGVVKMLLIELGHADMAYLVNPEAKIHTCTITMPQSFGDMAKVKGVMTDGSEELVFQYFADELHFSPEEFVGLTIEQACELYHKKDVAYLRS